MLTIVKIRVTARVAASGDPWANQARQASLLSSTASFTARVHQQVLGLLPGQALMTFCPQPLPAASKMQALNMTHSDSMSQTLAQKPNNKAPLQSMGQGMCVCSSAGKHNSVTRGTT